MNKQQQIAAAWIPFFQAVADGKTIQKQFMGGTWVDVDNILDYVHDDVSTIRIKPREFKNFALPWEFIHKRWNYATYSPGNLGGLENGGVILYETKPIFVEGSKTDSGDIIHAGWRSQKCGWCDLVPTQEGINTTDWLACRNEE